MYLGLGRMTTAERRMGRFMRGPEDHIDVDITTDLVDGSDGALGDIVQQNGALPDAQMQVPDGTQHVNQQPAVKDPAKPEGDKPVKELSLNEQLTEAFKGTEQQQPPAKPDAAAPALALTKDAAGKYHTADGAFASAEQIAAFEAQAAAAAPGNEQQQQPQFNLTGLTAVEQQQFQSLPAEIQQLVGRTMEGLNARAARYNEYDAIEQQILGPRRQQFAAEGMNAFAVTNQLFAMSDFAARDPGNFVLWFAQQRGIDLDALLEQQFEAQQNTNPQIQQLQGQVAQLNGFFQNQQQQQYQQGLEQRTQEVQAFCTANDAAGKPLRPYMNDVMDAWIAQLGVVRQAEPSLPNDQAMQKAYDYACWANPTVRGQMQQAEAERVRAEEAARVQNAKNASASVTGGPNGSDSAIPNNKDTSVRGLLEAAFAEAEAV